MTSRERDSAIARARRAVSSNPSYTHFTSQHRGNNDAIDKRVASDDYVDSYSAFLPLARLALFMATMRLALRFMMRFSSDGFQPKRPKSISMCTKNGAVTRAGGVSFGVLFSRFASQPV